MKTIIKERSCLECRSVATKKHHIIPASRGGTQTVDLCSACHGLVHNANWRNDDLAELIREGRRKKGLPVVTLTEDQEHQICFDYRCGDSMRDIADRLGLNLPVISHRLRKHNEPIRARGNRRSPKMLMIKQLNPIKP